MFCGGVTLEVIISALSLLSNSNNSPPSKTIELFEARTFPHLLTHTGTTNLQTY